MWASVRVKPVDEAVNSDELKASDELISVAGNTESVAADSADQLQSVPQKMDESQEHSGISSSDTLPNG